MSERFFIDTNIFVYTFSEIDKEKNKKARELIRTALSTGLGCVSTQVVQEFFHVALRKFSRQWTIEESAAYVATVFRPLCRLHTTLDLTIRALRIAKNENLSFFDASIVASALELECRVLISEDMQDGRSFESVRIENPFTLLK